MYLLSTRNLAMICLVMAILTLTVLSLRVREVERRAIEGEADRAPLVGEEVEESSGWVVVRSGNTVGRAHWYVDEVRGVVVVDEFYLETGEAG